MSEEEKEVLQIFKNGLGLSYAEEKIILNLIDRLQKELEQEKERNKILELDNKALKNSYNELFENSINKDKIINKIKELKEEIKENKKENSVYHALDTQIKEAIVEGLEDLLKNNKSNAEDTIKWILSREMKYKELKNPCKEMLEKGLCLGCNKLEIEDFVGEENCIYDRDIKNIRVYNISFSCYY